MRLTATTGCYARSSNIHRDSRLASPHFRSTVLMHARPILSSNNGTGEGRSVRCRSVRPCRCLNACCFALQDHRRISRTVCLSLKNSGRTWRSQPICKARLTISVRTGMRHCRYSTQSLSTLFCWSAESVQSLHNTSCSMFLISNGQCHPFHDQIGMTILQNSANLEGEQKVSREAAL